MRHIHRHESNDPVGTYQRHLLFRWTAFRYTAGSAASSRRLSLGKVGEMISDAVLVLSFWHCLSASASVVGVMIILPGNLDVCNSTDHSHRCLPCFEIEEWNPMYTRLDACSTRRAWPGDCVTASLIHPAQVNGMGSCGFGGCAWPNSARAALPSSFDRAWRYFTGPEWAS